MSNNTTSVTDDEIASVFNHPTKITQAIQESIYAALLQHKQAGNPVCEWRNGQVHWITADKIKIRQQNET